MAMIANDPASSRSASVSTLANTISGYSTDAASKTGANVRHGPHHDAQKSTSTMSFDDKTSSKFFAVRLTVAMLMPSLVSATLRCSTAIPQRVFRPQHTAATEHPERSVWTD